MPRKQGLNQALRELLVSSFEGRELEILVEDVFNEPLDSLVQPGNTKVRTFDLIKWAQSEGELGNLIREAAYLKPSNFYKFILDYLDEILVTLELEEVDGFLRENLRSLAKAIQQYKAVGLAVKACIETLPESALQDSEKEIEYLEDDQISDDYRLYILLKLLLDYKEKKGVLRILYFIEALSEQEEIESKLRDKLTELLPPELFPKKTVPDTVPVLDRLQEILPWERKKKIDPLNGYLLIKLIKANSIGKSELYLTSFLRYGDDSDVFHPVDLADSLEESSQKGTSCSCQNLAKTVSKLIRLGDRKFDKNKRDNKISGELILEFILPYDYLLAEAIDLWKIEIFPGNEVPIGSRYKIILRSSERISIPNLFARLGRKTRRLQDLLKQSEERKITPKKWRENFFHLGSIDGLRKYESPLEQKIGIKLTCGLPEDREKQEQLVRDILYTDVPFVIWNRSQTLAATRDLSKEMDEFLKIEHFQDLMKLLDCVETERTRTARSDNPENYLGHHLAFLYDDPDRPLPHLKQLQLFSTE